MTLAMFDALPASAGVAGHAAHLAAGIALGVVYFHNLWRSVRRLTGGGGALAIIIATLGRFVLLGGVLALASLEGPRPLLMMALGVLIGRAVMLRRIRITAP